LTILEIGSHTHGEKNLNNLALRIDRGWRSCSAPAGVLYRQVEGG
jgi:hypothetical protein